MVGIRTAAVGIRSRNETKLCFRSKTSLYSNQDQWNDPFVWTSTCVYKHLPCSVHPGTTLWRRGSGGLTLFHFSRSLTFTSESNPISRIYVSPAHLWGNRQPFFLFILFDFFSLPRKELYPLIYLASRRHNRTLRKSTIFFLMMKLISGDTTYWTYLYNGFQNIINCKALFLDQHFLA